MIWYRSILPICILVCIFSHNAFCGKITLKLKDAERPIKHLYIDFDHTITVDGFSGDIRDIFCRGEKYPNCNCNRLPGKVCNGTDNVSANEMVASLDSLPKKGITALIKSFGGNERLQHFREWLKRQREALNGHVYIVSTSWFPVTALQWKLYLKRVSDNLNLGFDLDHIQTLADPGAGLSADKGSVIKRNMMRHDIEFDQAIFADDSSGNIKSAKGVCNTIYLPQKKGMDTTDLEYIETLISGCCRWKAKPLILLVNSFSSMIKEMRDMLTHLERKEWM